ncbi:unnamed protein product [Adineta ricciae]|uniref:FAM234A/B beta-propeller domain-containing protein n=3 Tax=Adineta ricciae TaxID=249248 RepID=A0A813Q7W5_ADIRI|nr:unnamed protein product [Adineta ricciae]CAF1357880.1 unnamed protein product [Adineta ricciae]
MDDENEIFIGTFERVPPVKKTRCAARCVTISLIASVIICIVVIVRTSTKSAARLKVNALWFPSAGSESCIRLMDINGDGLDDVIVGVTEVTAITNEIKKEQNRSAFCESLNVEEPCSGTMYGIRGYDFSILWSFRMKESIFELVCDLIDLNNDGHRDCIGAGRQASVVAFDPYHGKIIWDSRNIRSRRVLWNFYNPVLLPVDVDGDGMNDILISHGGNPTIPSEVHEREAGCLLILSSRNGSQIGEPFWMPDGKETYMSPILYNNETILFGTGGETVPGGLYSISLDNLLKGHNQYITVVQSKTKGIMVPPVILDIDHDAINDILVSHFDGTLELIDGKTMAPLWSRVFEGWEFYTTPAPGDFNSDSFVDFMLILNRGEWDRYNYSEVVIIDGLTGETIWKKRNQFGEFTAPLTLQMKNNGKYQDSFIYRQRGQKSEGVPSNTSLILFHGIGLQDGEISKNDGAATSNLTSSCDSFTLTDSVAHIYLTNIHGTHLIGSIYPPMNNQNELCSDFEPMERAGGALGDLDGDGVFDTVDITTFITKLTSHTLHAFRAHSVLTRFPLNANLIEPQIIASYQTDISSRTVNDKLLESLRRKTSLSKKSIVFDKDSYVIPKQTWNAYLGRFANSHYYRNIE